MRRRCTKKGGEGARFRHSTSCLPFPLSVTRPSARLSLLSFSSLPNRYWRCTHALTLTDTHTSKELIQRPRSSFMPRSECDGWIEDYPHLRATSLSFSLRNERWWSCTSGLTYTQCGQGKAAPYSAPFGNYYYYTGLSFFFFSLFLCSSPINSHPAPIIWRCPLWPFHPPPHFHNGLGAASIL